MPKYPVPPKTQALSDAMMMLRYAQLEVKECAAKAQNALLEAQNEAMDKGVPMMASDLGFAEAALIRMMAGHGDARDVHARISGWARAHGFDLPAAPAYSQEYLDLAAATVPLKLSNHPRR
jgi:hypothetical protein